MKKLLLLCTSLLLAGCLGTHTGNPMKETSSSTIWWRADTAAITSNNPWDAFRVPVKSDPDKHDVRYFQHYPVRWPRSMPEPYQAPQQDLKTDKSGEKILKRVLKEGERREEESLRGEVY